MAERSFSEGLCRYKDQSGHAYKVTVELVEGKPPAILISDAGGSVSIEVEDWDVIVDCVRRGIDAVGTHPDEWVEPADAA